MKLTFLGTGTSTGVPMIRCTCPVCTSVDPRNYRRRTSLYVRGGGMHVIVDTAPDFREQALTFGVERVDALLFTHSHADHIFGMDDIRRFNTVQNAVIPAWASPETLADLRRIYNYVTTRPTAGLYRPLIDFREINGVFSLAGLRVTPVDVQHAGIRTFGFRFDADGRSVGYVPDCAAMDEHAIAVFSGVDIMILDTLRYRPHCTHLTLEQSLSLLSRIRPKKAFTVHMCHDFDHAQLQQSLPANMTVSFDGLTVEV